MLTAPIPATALALRKTGLSIDDIDLVEINEAFACVPLAWQRETGADLSRVVTLRTLREGLRYCADRDDEDDEFLDEATDGAAAPVRDDGPIIP